MFDCPTASVASPAMVNNTAAKAGTEGHRLSSSEGYSSVLGDQHCKCPRKSYLYMLSSAPKTGKASAHSCRGTRCCRAPQASSRDAGRCTCRSTRRRVEGGGRCSACISANSRYYQSLRPSYLQWSQAMVGTGRKETANSANQMAKVKVFDVSSLGMSSASLCFVVHLCT